MPVAIPPELKQITAYIRRAEELDADKSDPDNHRIISYHCRSFAMEKAMGLRSAGAGGGAVDGFLMTLMEQLETMKKDITMPRDEAKVLCEGHAVRLFHRADDEDRGDSDNYREIARTFYNATSFFDILEQFGPLDEELSSKRTYSKWKATEIMKALKEGRTPTSGGYGGDNAPVDKTPTLSNANVPTPDIQGMSFGGGDNSTPISQTFNMPPAPTGMNNLNSLPTVPGFQIPQQPQYGQQQQFQPPPQQFQPPPQQQFQPPQQTQNQQLSQQPASHQPSPNYVPPPKTNLQSNIADALELCAFAMAALKHNDTKMGKQRLLDAINLLP